MSADAVVRATKGKLDMKNRRKPIPEQMDLLALMEQGKMTDQQMNTLKGIVALRGQGPQWRGDSIVPPGSLLDEMASLFRRTTDFPLELPVIMTLHALAAYMLKRGAEASIGGTRVRPDLWTTLLAPSSAGKTKTTTVIKKVMPLHLFPEVTTAARFIIDLTEHNHSAWFQDEWAQLLKRMESQTYAEELRDYLLRLHDNNPISRRTKTEEVAVADPALVVLGTTVEQTFLENVSAESMLDGFMQRFGFIIADLDPSRTPDMFPIYRVEEPTNLDPLHKAWQKLKDIPLHSDYEISREAEKAYVDGFRAHYHRHREIPASFFRRVMWRTFKYALVYHVLLGKDSKVLDAQDVGWAMRVSEMHLADSRRLLERYNLTKLEALVVKAEALQAKLGRRPSTRELISGVRGINNANMARFILELMCPPPAANDNIAGGTQADDPSKRG
ncbi:MAG: DUF3987 domain-containing protein [Magnetospirillum gryphiswaldense]|nr:DUF3987 domain-containing protein [Magnetospirillum gryphiswaldense]